MSSFPVRGKLHVLFSVTRPFKESLLYSYDTAHLKSYSIVINMYRYLYKCLLACSPLKEVKVFNIDVNALKV
jgi:hypothetical protein